ncbi:MAG: YHS domain-containing protein [Phycisphaerae bacterium]|nr:YHS domain-containing protein [Phycisphaerae bacterium]
MKRHVSSYSQSPVWHRYSVITAVFIVVALARVPETLAQAPVNKMCPVMSLEEADPAITTQYHGKTIAFCCDNCLKKFRANPERYAGNTAVLADDKPDQAKHERTSKGGAAEHGHDHASDEPRTPFLARIHPIVVHLPLAGTPIALVATLGWLASRRKLFAYADVPALVLAAASSIVGVVTGNIAHDSMRFSPALHGYVEWHQFSATALMILLLVLSGVRLWRWRRLSGRWFVAYATGLIAASALVGAVGFLGGSLVFGPDHLWP